MQKNRQKYLLLAMLLFSMVYVYGQSRLELKQPRIYYTSAFSIGAFTTGYIYSNKVSGLTINQLNAISPNTLSGFDRRAIDNYDINSRRWSDVSVVTTAALPGILSLYPRVRKDFFNYNIIYANTLLASMGEVLLLKALTKKNRPFAYNPNVSLQEKLENSARFSFPSGHTAVAATATYFFAATYSIYYPESRHKKWVWVGAAILPLITGYLRYSAGKHFVSDIAVGYTIGAINGVVFPLLFRKKN